MGKNSAGKEAEAARRDEEARQAEIRAGTKKINTVFDRQFNEPFFKGREKAYRDFALPQLDEQHKEAGDELTFDLARRGVLDSSMRGEKVADLTQLYDTSRQDVLGRAREFGTEARTSVEDARTDLVRTLQATGDAAGAGRSAIDRASALSRMPSISPLERVFVDFTNALGTQAGLERAHAAGGPKPRYNLGLYGTNDSVKVT